MIVKMCKHGGNVVPNKLPNKSFIGGILKTKGKRRFFFPPNTNFLPCENHGATVTDRNVFHVGDEKKGRTSYST